MMKDAKVGCLARFKRLCNGQTDRLTNRPADQRTDEDAHKKSNNTHDSFSF